ncbi:MAG: RhuM family protein [Eubacteriales bacterium]
MERVRSIRASERRIWLQITDVFAECSIDYDNQAHITKEFYAMVQNKFHFAITGQTAAEIIDSKADRTKENMGLTTWKNAPDGRVLKSDVIIGKNYLDEKEIRRLERAVSGYFDYIKKWTWRESNPIQVAKRRIERGFLSITFQKVLTSVLKNFTIIVNY